MRFSQPLSGSSRAGWHSADYVGQEAQARAAQRGVHATGAEAVAAVEDQALMDDDGLALAAIARRDADTRRRAPKARSRDSGIQPVGPSNGGIAEGGPRPWRGSLLLEQSYLSRFRSWSFDNATHALVIE